MLGDLEATPSESGRKLRLLVTTPVGDAPAGAQRVPHQPDPSAPVERLVLPIDHRRGAVVDVEHQGVENPSIALEDLVDVGGRQMKGRPPKLDLEKLKLKKENADDILEALKSRWEQYEDLRKNGEMPTSFIARLRRIVIWRRVSRQNHSTRSDSRRPLSLETRMFWMSLLENMGSQNYSNHENSVVLA